VHVGDVSRNAGAGELEYLGDAEVFGNLQEVMDEVGDDSGCGCLIGPLTTSRPLLIRSRMSCIGVFDVFTPFSLACLGRDMYGLQ
jgi:hypothetical protein